MMFWVCVGLFFFGFLCGVAVARDDGGPTGKIDEGDWLYD